MSEHFEPTAAQRRCKAMLHKSCPEGVLSRLTLTDSELVRYVAPTPMPLLRKWVGDNKEFWPWLLTPVETDGKLLEAKELAFAFLVDVLKLPHIKDDGTIDYEVLKHKQKAAESITVQKSPLVQVANVQNGVTPRGTLAPGQIPKGLSRKSSAMIEGKIAELAPASIIDAEADSSEIGEDEI